MKKHPASLRKHVKSGLPELLAPAGGWPALTAALEAGADAVYFGLDRFTMRAMAGNFRAGELKRVMKYIHGRGKKGYLALNTIIFDRELSALARVMDAAQASGVDAVIAWDMAAVVLAEERGIPVHLSTQASVSNAASARFYASQGVSRIVLARECGLSDISRIGSALRRQRCRVGLEIFIHGAQCMSISGRCLLSLVSCNRSANRGECIHPCRRRYLIKDAESGVEFETGADYILSARDLCTIMIIDRLIEAGAAAFKIEGRMRPPEYVGAVVAAYRRAMDAYALGVLTPVLKQRLFSELQGTFNRGFSTGYYLGVPSDTGAGPGKSLVKKVYAGRVENFYPKINVAAVRLHSAALVKGSEILIYGKTTPPVSFRVSRVEVDRQCVEKAVKGQLAGIEVPAVVRRNDQVFLMERI